MESGGEMQRIESGEERVVVYVREVIIPEKWIFL